MLGGFTVPDIGRAPSYHCNCYLQAPRGAERGIGGTLRIDGKSRLFEVNIDDLYIQ